MNAQQSTFEDVKRMIVEDNKRSGVQPKSSLIATGIGLCESMNGGTVTSIGVLKDDFADSTLATIPNGSANGTSPRKKPPVQPKPDALHGKALHSSSTDSQSHVSDLANRFARLRSPAPTTPTQDPRIRTQPIAILEDQGSTTKSPLSTQSTAFPTSIRPLGPREMPSVPTSAPRSNRLPLDTDIPGMPKAPDAIYSPSRNPDTAATINFPTSIPRSSSYFGNGNNAAPPVSSAARTPSLDGRQEYLNPAQKLNGSRATRPDPIIPDSTTVIPSELTEYIRKGSQVLRILLIDVRSREEFDDGHIMCSSIICIEPSSLRNAMSAEDIAETLVLSPDAEVKLYEHRHEFDLVVLYDQCSLTLKQSIGDKLEILVKAMCEYGYEKRLKRRPMLLVGGVDAWTDLLGASSLQSSSTGPLPLKSTNETSIKPARPLGRRDANRFVPGRKRAYQSRTLSKEEENRWDETLREHPADENAPSYTDQSSDDLSYVRTTEDFFRRYPEVPSIQESMVSALPAPKRVAYGHAPVNSIPDPPTRPAPALPRTRSSGVLERAPVPSYTMNSGIGTGSAVLERTSGITGLSNSGTTCYVNAVVQCLSMTGPLRNYLVNFRIGGNNVKVPRNAVETSDPPQLLVRAFGNLLGHMWSGRYDYVAPNTFLVSCAVRRYGF
jgi:ubiquitin carboxyl-terminal hydrolase 8